MKAYQVSYNEIYEQPNWVDYVVTDRPKNVDRGNMNFHLEEGVFTSSNSDYYANRWDKGHMAPARTFSDSFDNLYATFSFVNCAMQVDSLNRKQWNYLEMQEREWAKEYDSIQVKILLDFNESFNPVASSVNIPIGFSKKLLFSDGSTLCYYFENEIPDKNYEAYATACD
ncbi:MAG: DNA/RNA non-specific endonuclease [Flavobacteriaceae bacterium]